MYYPEYPAYKDISLTLVTLCLQVQGHISGAEQSATRSIGVNFSTYLRAPPVQKLPAYLGAGIMKLYSWQRNGATLSVILMEIVLTQVDQAIFTGPRNCTLS